MKTWEEINVKEKLSYEDFYTLFTKLPLTEDEKTSIKEYHGIYEAFIAADVPCEDSWIVTRNIFAIKNQQIAERIKENK